VSCKKCFGKKVVKSGFVRGLQRYKCKVCGCNFTETKERGRPLSQKLLALSLYASGLSMNRISQYFNVSTPAVLRWIKILTTKLCVKPEPEGRVIVMELDEMWHYVRSKKTNSGYGRRMILIEDASLTGNVGIVIKQP